MINYVMKKIIGTKNEREVKRITKMVGKINSLESQMEKLSEEELKNKTVESIEELNRKKEMLQNGIKNRYIFIESDKKPVFEIQ